MRRKPPDLWPWVVGFICLCLYFLVVLIVQTQPPPPRP